jgi:hypothetical protein
MYKLLHKFWIGRAISRKMRQGVDQVSASDGRS